MCHTAPPEPPSSRYPIRRSGDFAGRQLDGRVRWWIVPAALRLELNGVWLSKADFLKAAPNAPLTGDSRYLSLNLTALF